MAKERRIAELKAEYAAIHDEVLQQHRRPTPNEAVLARLQRRENAINDELQRLGTHL